MFRSEIYSLGITWIDCDILSNNQQKKWVQKIKGQYLNRSTFWMIKDMNVSVFSKARYMNGVGFERLACTGVPKLPLSYPPPPTPRGLASCLNWNAQRNSIKRTRLYNFYPLKPHFYTVKRGFTGVYIIFLISAQKHRLWVLVRTAILRRF